MIKSTVRFIVGVILLAAALAVAMSLAPKAQAQVGVAHGIKVGPRVPSPTTVKVGPVYATPGGGGGGTVTGLDDAATKGTELSSFLANDNPHAVKKRAESKHCDYLHARYIGRHGLTTPQPLKGYSGCKKWAMDQAYWQTHRHERVSHTTLGNQIAHNVHDAVFGW